MNEYIDIAIGYELETECKIDCADEETTQKMNVFRVSSNEEKNL